MKIVKKFMFNSAHFLPHYKGKCKQLHGHTYFLDVILDGEINPDTGMIMDFKDIEYIVTTKVIDRLDHKLLNDVIDNPTAENTILWIRKELSKIFENNSVTLRLWENPNSYVEL